MRSAKKTPHEFPRHGFQSLVPTLALLFTSRRTCSLTVIYSIFFFRANRDTQLQLQAATGTQFIVRTEREGAVEVKMEMLPRQR